MRCRMRFRIVFVISLSSICLGCVRTQMTSQTRQELRGLTYHRVLAKASFQNLKFRRIGEERLCSEIVKKTMCTCLRSAEIFFPGQEWPAEEVASHLVNLEVDAILTLEPTERGTFSAYVPATEYSKGFFVDKPWSNYKVELWSTAVGQIAWYATGTSSAGAYRSQSDLIRSTSSKVVGKLISDGVLR